MCTADGRHARVTRDPTKITALPRMMVESTGCVTARASETDAPPEAVVAARPPRRSHQAPVAPSKFAAVVSKRAANTVNALAARERVAEPPSLTGEVDEEIAGGETEAGSDRRDRCRWMAKEDRQHDGDLDEDRGAADPEHLGLRPDEEEHRLRVRSSRRRGTGGPAAPESTTPAPSNRRGERRRAPALPSLDAEVDEVGAAGELHRRERPGTPKGDADQFERSFRSVSVQPRALVSATVLALPLIVGTRHRPMGEGSRL
jgi:hypothetical protein